MTNFRRHAAPAACQFPELRTPAEIETRARSDDSGVTDLWGAEGIQTMLFGFRNLEHFM